MRTFAHPYGLCHAGITAGNGTVLTTDTFSCVGWSSTDARHWLGMFTAPPFRDAWIPILSATLGVLASAYHLTRIYTTDEATSLWALPDPELGPTSVGAAKPSLTSVAPEPTPTSAHTPAPAAGAAAAPALPTAEPPERAVCEADEITTDLHRDDFRCDLSVHTPTEAPCRAAASSVAMRGASWRSDGGAPPPPPPRRGSRASRVSRLSVRGLLAAQPQLAQLLLYTAAVYACFVVDITFMMHLWLQFVATMLLVAPHVSLHGAAIALLFGLAALRAVVVTGTGSTRAWLSAFSKVRPGTVQYVHACGACIGLAVGVPRIAKLHIVGRVCCAVCSIAAACFGS